MSAITRRPPQAVSFINRNPEGAALAAILAGLSLLGAMMPPSRPAALVAEISPALAPLSATFVPATPAALAATLPIPQAPAQPALAPDQAFAINAAMPISTLANPRATPFMLSAGDAPSRARALDCLTAAIYYESASESDEGQAAVAQVVLNRVRNPAFPKSICAVVFDGAADHGGLNGNGGCQFTFACDGAMNRAPSPAGWQRARRAAQKALAGGVAPAVGWSTHYHTQWVAPAWAPTLLKTAVIGAHIFYRLPARAAAAAYAGREPEIAQMAALSSVPMSLPPAAMFAAATPPPQPGAPGSGTLAMVLPGI